MNAFIEALSDYQSATLRMNQALQRLIGQNYDVYSSVKNILSTTVSAITPRSLDSEQSAKVFSRPVSA